MEGSVHSKLCQADLCRLLHNCARVRISGQLGQRWYMDRRTALIARWAIAQAYGSVG
jgi:hypothetical protein